MRSKMGFHRMNRPPRRKSLADGVYEELRRLIVMLELPPGAVLVDMGHGADRLVPPSRLRQLLIVRIDQLWELR